MEVGLEDLLWDRNLDLDLLCSVTASDLHKIQTAVDPLISLKETIIFAFKRGKNPASENPQVEIKKIRDFCYVL